jgi:hypothetical protein
MPFPIGLWHGSFCSVYGEEGDVEPNREHIEDVMRRYGYAENEAEVAYHLEQAQDLITEMLEESFASGSSTLPGFVGGVFRMSNVDPHFRALFALLDRRVLGRHYPGRLGSPDSDTDVQSG